MKPKLPRIALLLLCYRVSPWKVQWQNYSNCRHRTLNKTENHCQNIFNNNYNNYELRFRLWLYPIIYWKRDDIGCIYSFLCKVVPNVVCLHTPFAAIIGCSSAFWFGRKVLALIYHTSENVCKVVARIWTFSIMLTSLTRRGVQTEYIVF